MANSWYNGYSPDERSAKGEDGRQRRKRGTLPAFDDPCAMCGDPKATVEPHSEDYSQPYSWEQPAVYALCRHCHRNKLHKRFADPIGWFVFKAHLKRGGYASEIKFHGRELRQFRRNLERGLPARLPAIRDRTLTGREWWDLLSVDPLTLTSASARPRK